MLKRRLVFLCLLIVSALGLVACGDGASDESQIEDAVEISATSDDPADCKKLSTQRFMEQTTKSSGSEAVESCEEELSKDEGVEKATVSTVEVEGSKATADAVLAGGAFDGQEVEIALVEDDGQWKLDEIVRFIGFDPTKVTASFEREFAKPSAEISKRRADCIVEAFEGATEAELEDALLSPSTEGFEEIAGSCLS